MSTTTITDTERQARRQQAQEFLVSEGFSVMTLDEKTPAQARGNSLYERILLTYRDRLVVGSGGRPPKQPDDIDPSTCGYTDAEVSAILDHPDLHRRCAELRSCGLLTDVVAGTRHIRTADSGVRGSISVITPPGVSSLSFLRKQREALEASSKE